jgi:hypothetical protein
MVYAPRDDDELEIVLRIAGASQRHAEACAGVEGAGGSRR